jgi:hypothetical protein
LLENWVSAFFEYFGQDPIAFVLLQNSIVILIFATLSIVWGILGQQLGIIPGFGRSRSAIKDSELTDLSDRVSFSIQSSEDWIEKIQNGISTKKNLLGVDTFYCCFVPTKNVTGLKDQKLNGATDGSLECHPKNKSPLNEEISEEKYSIGCSSKLVYSISLKNRSINRDSTK